MSDYTDLAARAGQGRLERLPNTELGAAGAKAAIDAAFAQAAGTQTADEAYQLAAGRPSLNRPATPSRMWRLRVPDSLDQRVRAYAEATNRTISDVAREAVDAYLTRQAVVQALLESGVFTRLKDEGVFARVALDYGVLTLPDADLDLSTECLCRESVGVVSKRRSSPVEKRNQI